MRIHHFWVVACQTAHQMRGAWGGVDIGQIGRVSATLFQRQVDEFPSWCCIRAGVERGGEVDYCESSPASQLFQTASPKVFGRDRTLERQGDDNGQIAVEICLLLG
ncbi:MAG TPA: hypothetical protein DIU07_06605 [Rhodobacteraceae bacterium]|nr:hypothetical protein [Paracoccaceae bacterium]